MVHHLSLPISHLSQPPSILPFEHQGLSALTIKVNSFHPARSDTVPFVVGGVLAGLIVVVSCHLHQSSCSTTPKDFNLTYPRFWSHILWFGCAGETAWQRTDNRRLCKYSHWKYIWKYIFGNIFAFLLLTENIISIECWPIENIYW